MYNSTASPNSNALLALKKIWPNKKLTLHNSKFLIDFVGVIKANRLKLSSKSITISLGRAKRGKKKWFLLLLACFIVQLSYATTPAPAPALTCAGTIPIPAWLRAELRAVKQSKGVAEGQEGPVIYIAHVSIYKASTLFGQLMQELNPHMHTSFAHTHIEGRGTIKPAVDLFIL